MAKLYIVPTPIGNVKDITERAREVLSSTEIILSEDTLVTKKLLRLLDIDYSNKQFITYFEHNERKRLDDVISLLNVHDAALVTDAGTPLLSDPGFPLVRALRSNHPDIKIEVLPGATSITTALVSSGFPTDKFIFMGYISRRPADRRKMFKAI